MTKKVESINPRSVSVKKWRDKQIAKGRCRFCKKKAVKGKTMCRYHLDYFKWRKRLKKQ